MALSDDELLRKYRFPRQELILLFEEMMEPQLRRRARRSQALPVHTQVLLAMRLFASGSFQNVIGDTAGKILVFIDVLFSFDRVLSLALLLGLFSDIHLHILSHSPKTNISAFNVLLFGWDTLPSLDTLFKDNISLHYLI